MKRLLFVLISILLPFVAMAQGAGGEIRRPGRANTNSNTQQGRFVNTITNKADGYEYVDLGLSVKWASCNIGASSPLDNGYYFAWGDTTAKTDFGSSIQNKLPTDIGNNISGTIYDAASSLLGGNWRMPTKSEAQELIDKCKWNKTKYKGVDGFSVTGPNGNSIFLPAAGYISENVRHSGYFVMLWTASAELDSQYGLCWVYHMYIDNNVYQNPPVQPKLVRESYYVGMTIRPVIS